MIILIVSFFLVARMHFSSVNILKPGDFTIFLPNLPLATPSIPKLSIDQKGICVQQLLALEGSLIDFL